MFPVKLDVGLKDLHEPTYKVNLQDLLTPAAAAALQCPYFM
jgi:hypothetical protein